MIVSAARRTGVRLSEDVRLEKRVLEDLVKEGMTYIFLPTAMEAARRGIWKYTAVQD